MNLYPLFVIIIQGWVRCCEKRSIEKTRICEEALIRWHGVRIGTWFTNISLKSCFNLNGSFQYEGYPFILSVPCYNTHLNDIPIFIYTHVFSSSIQFAHNILTTLIKLTDFIYIKEFLLYLHNLETTLKKSVSLRTYKEAIELRKLLGILYGFFEYKS